MRKIAVYMLTCSERKASAEAMLASWNQSDWGSAPQPLFDRVGDMDGTAWGSPGRYARMVILYAGLLGMAVEKEGADEDWMLFLEDDIEVHPHIGSLVESWPALDDPRCLMASLYNPSLSSISKWGEMERAFAADPAIFSGAQALLLRRKTARRFLAEWESVPGTQTQRLTKLIGLEGPIWVHKPSLVQHVATDSSWGARISKAPDYDPTFRG